MFKLSKHQKIYATHYLRTRDSKLIFYIYFLHFKNETRGLSRFTLICPILFGTVYWWLISIRFRIDYKSQSNTAVRRMVVFRMPGKMSSFSEETRKSRRRSPRVANWAGFIQGGPARIALAHWQTHRHAVHYRGNCTSWGWLRFLPVRQGRGSLGLRGQRYVFWTDSLNAFTNPSIDSERMPL